MHTIHSLTASLLAESQRLEAEARAAGATITTTSLQASVDGYTVTVWSVNGSTSVSIDPPLEGVGGVAV